MAEDILSLLFKLQTTHYIVSLLQLLTLSEKYLGFFFCCNRFQKDSRVTLLGRPVGQECSPSFQKNVVTENLFPVPQLGLINIIFPLSQFFFHPSINKVYRQAYLFWEFSRGKQLKKGQQEEYQLVTMRSALFWTQEKANLQIEGSEPAIGNYSQQYILVMATVPVAIIQ